MSDIRFNQWLHNSGTGGVSQVDGGHVGIGTTNPLIPVGSGVTAILNVGVVTANHYYGDGSNLTGIVGGGTSLSFNDNIGAFFGNSQDLKIHHDGNHSYIDDQGTGNLRLRSGTLEILNLAGNKTSALFSSGGGQTLNFNNNTKFVTTNTGAIVTGILTTTILQIDRGSDSEVALNINTTSTSTACRIRFSESGTEKGELAYSHDNDQIELIGKSGQSIGFFTNGSNLRANFTTSGHFVPNGNNVFDLGSTAHGWRNVYMNDLNLSNMGGDKNDVDGTQGSWTIQEGKDDLYIINRLNGKKFKIKLEEIS
tara:strand:- start:779 stop:1708 length:930 start_codon:yes stop_codon:yes gene_type:complete